LSTYILATGRRDPRMYAIDLQSALLPQNDKTPNAIVSRSKVALDRLDGKKLGDPANVVVSEDGATAYVVNHHGVVDSEEFLQHGGRGSIAVMDIRKMIDRRNDDTAAALERQIDSGHFGAVGLVLLPELFVIGNAESYLTEEGDRLTFVDRRTGSLRGQVVLSPPKPGCSCPNGVALGRAHDGRRYLFTANGATDDVSVIDLERALAGEKSAEILRIPVQLGPWGIAATPDARLVIAASREKQLGGADGNTISIIDVDRAAARAADAEAARVLVGADDPKTGTRPFIPSVTPDGRFAVVPNSAVDNVSIVDIEQTAEVARIPVARPVDADGQRRPSRPSGSAVTADGRYAAITGGGRTSFAPSGTVWIIDLAKRAVAATVTGVGNDPYGVALVDVQR
jgi:DNA-binding beta-propeller fold protein YncE